MLSVLMSVYWKEQPEALDAALESLVAQTVQPTEVVLVKDGPLGAELDTVINRYSSKLPIRVHPLPSNVGLSAALNEGLAIASQPWIMRFDSDDICVPQRIEIQQRMAMTGNLDLFGGQIREFNRLSSDAQRSRIVPCEHDAIRRQALRRNPFNHMTVCYRRELVLAAGGYPHIPLMEDYALWLTLLAEGARTANCEEVLVYARTGNGMLARRGGRRYVQSEWRLQEHMVRLGLKSRLSAVLDGCIRSAVFASPTALRGVFYSSLLRSKS